MGGREKVMAENSAIESCLNLQSVGDEEYTCFPGHSNRSTHLKTERQQNAWEEPSSGCGTGQIRGW